MQVGGHPDSPLTHSMTLRGKHFPSLGLHTAFLPPLCRCNPLFVRCLKPNHKKVCDG